MLLLIWTVLEAGGFGVVGCSGGCGVMDEMWWWIRYGVMWCSDVELFSNQILLYRTLYPENHLPVHYLIW